MSLDTVLSAPCVVFAMRRESMYFRRAFPFHQRFIDTPCTVQLRRQRGTSAPCSEASVLMLETGIGAAAMGKALDWCLGRLHLGNVPYRPSFLICVGFSGALQPEQRVGDLVLASEIVDQHGRRWPVSLPDSSAGGGFAVGRLLTVSKLVTDPQEKRRLGEQYRALAVDMESAIVARLCHQHNIPFACLRVISDDWQTPLAPQLVELLCHERVSIPRLARQVLRHPKLIGELWRLAGHTRRASRRLVSPLSALIKEGLRTGAVR